MLREVDRDIAARRLYMSPRLSPDGVRHYPALLREASQEHDEIRLARELRELRFRSQPPTRWLRSKWSLVQPSRTVAVLTRAASDRGVLPAPIVRRGFNRFRRVRERS
jgi:hypothetical protein